MAKAPARIAVLGQGIAGTLVSARLREARLAHVVFDPGHASASSHAAAGLVNPVTGRRFVLVEGFADYVAHFGIYARLRELLGGGPYLQPLTIYRDLARVKDRNQWDLRRATEAYAAYLERPVQAGAIGLPIGRAERWLGPTTGAFRVDLPGLIRDYRRRLGEEGRLREAAVAPDRLPRRGGGFALDGQRFDVVVDCRGAACAKTEEWADRPWRLSKGESVRLELPDWPRAAATKLGGDFLTPIGTGDTLWYGGTSTDRFDDAAPTSGAEERFAAGLADVLGTEARAALTDHRAAVRPTTRDRQWIVGAHARIPGLYSCNGLGTKGALTAPSASARLLSILVNDLATGR